MRRWLLFVVSLLVPAVVSAQSPIAWTQGMQVFDSSRVLLDSSGNVYWIGVVNSSNGYSLYANKYSPTGIFLGNAIFATATPDPPTAQVAEPSIVGTTLYVGSNYSGSLIAAIDTTTMGTKWFQNLSGRKIYAVFGSPSQVVTVEYVGAANSNYVARRSTVNGNITTSTLVPVLSVQKTIMDTSGHTYVVGPSGGSSTSRLTRVNAGGSIHYNVDISVIGYGARNAVAIAINATTQELLIGYYAVLSGQTSSNALVRRAALATGSGSTWTFNASTGDEVIKSICPLPDGSACVAIQHWDLGSVYGTYLARRSASGTVWSKNLTKTISMTTDMALDPLGNLAVIRSDPTDPFNEQMIAEKLDPADGKPLWTHTFAGYPTQVASSPTGSHVIVSGDRYLHMTRGFDASFSKSTIVGGSPVSLDIMLTRPTPSANLPVQLFSNAVELPVPASITLPWSGTILWRVNLTSAGVTTTKNASVNIRYAGFIVQKQVALIPPILGTLAITPNKVTGGNPMNGTIAIVGAAPAGGWTVDTSSNNSSATVPATVTINEGASLAGFVVSTTPVSANTGIVITATKASVSRTAFVAVNAPTLSDFTLAASSIQGGANGSLTVTLAGNAPTGGYSIVLVSGAPSLVVLPSSTAVSAGSITRTLSFTTSAVTSTINVTLVAYRGSVVKTQTLTLTP